MSGFEQPVRKDRASTNEASLSYVEFLQELAKKTGESFENLVEMEKVLEMRRQNNLAKDDGDYRDEHEHWMRETLETGFKDLVEQLTYCTT